MSIFSRLFNKGQDQEGKSDEPKPPNAPAAPPAEQTPEGASSAAQPAAQSSRQEAARKSSSRNAKAEAASAPSSKAASTKETAPKVSAGVPVLNPDEEDLNAPTKEHARPSLVEAEAERARAEGLIAAATQRAEKRADSRPESRPESGRESSKASKPRAPSIPPPPPRRSSMPPPLPRAGDKARSTGRALADTPPDPRPRVVVEEDANDEAAVITRSNIVNARAVFQEAAATKMMPVRDFMFEVRSGRARADWLHTYDAAVKSLKKMAEGLELNELAEELGVFAEKLASAGDATGLMVDGGAREDLLRVYDRLVALLPAAFALDEEASRRETIVMNSLLLSIPGVERTTLERLYAAGMSSLERFYVAHPEEVAAVADVPVEVATAIVRTLKARRGDAALKSISSLPPPAAPIAPGAPPMPGVRGHPHTPLDTADGDPMSVDIVVDETPPPAKAPPAAAPAPAPQPAPPAAPPVALQAAPQVALEAATPAPPTAKPAPEPRPKVAKLPPDEARALATLVQRLRNAHVAFGALSDKWTDAATAERRKLRRARVEIAEKISELLTRVGEKDAESTFQKLSFDQKLTLVERYLKS